MQPQPLTQNQKKFKDYHEEFRSSLTEQQLKTFSGLKSNREKILFVANIKTCPMFPINAVIYQGKNLEEAKLLKNEGNVQFQKENYREAFLYYSKSILKTSTILSEFSEISSICYANRSAALYHLKEYNYAIIDIDFAFENKYPLHLWYKLLDRKARCLLALKKPNMASEVFKETITALDNAQLAIAKKQKWQKDIQIMLLMIRKNEEAKNIVKSSPVGNTRKKNKDIKYNLKYEALTSAVAIKYSDEMGRYAEAKINIKAGDILLTEQPHCAVLLEIYKNTHCHHCFKRIQVLYSCPTCDEIIFCSKECINIAISSYHGIECSILRTLWNANLSVTCLMALRIISQKPLQYFLEKKPTLNLLKSVEMKTYSSQDYEPVYCLISHEMKRKPEDLINRVHVALFFTQCLKLTPYFPQKSVKEKKNKIHKLIQSDEELYITELLLHHLQILQFNAHEVSELQIRNANTETGVSKFIGGALYPTLALFNHSCNPGVVRYFSGTKVIVRAIRSILVGQMIPENYGPIFTQTKKEERQRILREQYWFTCQCEACIHDWPLFTEMTKADDIRFRCTNKKCSSVIKIRQNNNDIIITCAECSEKINILKALKTLQETDSKFKTATNLMQVNKTHKAIQEFLEILQSLGETMVPPFKDYYVCLRSLCTCYLMMGNCLMTN